MSYVRLSIDSGVYLYDDCGGFYCCCWCALLTSESGGSTKLYTLQECLDHMWRHREAGHKVPEYVFETLQWELENGEDQNYERPAEDADTAQDQNTARVGGGDAETTRKSYGG